MRARLPQLSEHHAVASAALPITAQSGQSDRKGLGLRPTKRPNKSKKEGLIALWRPGGIIYGRSRAQINDFHTLYFPIKIINQIYEKRL